MTHASDKTGTLTVDGVEFDYEIEEVEVVQYQAVCVIDGQTYRTDVEETEREAVRELLYLMKKAAAKVRQNDLEQLDRWNRGLPRPDVAERPR